MTDEEAIALALLFGADMWSTGVDGEQRWYVDGEIPGNALCLHPIEEASRRRGGKPYFASAADLARAYIKWRGVTP